MSSKILTTDEKKQTIHALAKAKGNITKAAELLGLAKTTYIGRLDAARRDGLKIPTFKESSVQSPNKYSSSRLLTDIDKLRIKSLEKEIKELRHHNHKLADELLGADKVKQLIHQCDRKPRPREWRLVTRQKANTGVPTLFLSDLHWDENVNALSVNGVNAYDRKIAERRLKQFFYRGTDLLMNHMANPSYDYMVMPLGGDLFSGNIHEELRETNEYPIAVSLMDLFDRLVSGINMLKDAFGKVYIPCVPGNHGRFDQKKRFKNAVYDNFEWILYQLLARQYANDTRVDIQVSDSPDIQYNIFNVRYLLTHGDQFKGGSGIAGALSPLMIGDARKRKRSVAINQPYDIMIMGHWHQYIHLRSLIVNGSVKGYDEYAYAHNWEFELPQQAVWITHAKYGVTARWPVLLELYDTSFISK